MESESARWCHGTWLKREQADDETGALKSLDAWLGYPEGGRAALSLPGWDEYSVWGYDPPLDCYFAQLWRNRDGGGSPEVPDIWINGWDTVEGRPYKVTTTHRLAMEIMVATGHDLATVCAALATHTPG